MRNAPYGFRLKQLALFSLKVNPEPFDRLTVFNKVLLHRVEA